jgi:hypothetical protein
MLDNVTLQVFIGHFFELKDKINAVSAGQEELKTELNTDINGVSTAIKPNNFLYRQFICLDTFHQPQSNMYNWETWMILCSRDLGKK